VSGSSGGHDRRSSTLAHAQSTPSAPADLGTIVVGNRGEDSLGAARSVGRKQVRAQR
jgi:hypothetical protein